jgi:hypothetical protein
MIGANIEISYTETSVKYIQNTNIENVENGMDGQQPVRLQHYALVCAQHRRLYTNQCRKN